MKMEFMVYNLVFIMKMTVYTIWLVLLKGRASAVSFYGWVYLVVLLWVSDIGNNPIGKTRVLTFRRESEAVSSLRITHSRRHISPKPIIYVDIWIYDCWSTVNLITVHEPLVSLASPRFRALPPTINTIQNKRYCSH